MEQIPGLDNWLTEESPSTDPMCICGHRWLEHDDELYTHDATHYLDALKTIQHAINTEQTIGVIESIVKKALALCSECDCQEFKEDE